MLLADRLNTALPFASSIQPNLQTDILDLPHVAQTGMPRIEQAGLSSRIRYFDVNYIESVSNSHVRVNYPGEPFTVVGSISFEF